MKKHQKANTTINQNTKAKALTLFQKLDTFFELKEKKILFAIIIVASIFSILLFDLKVSISGDDSGYILAAKQFIAGEKFPSWHGSFYPIFLSFFMLIFGFKITILKILSFILIIGHFLIFYKALKPHLSKTLLISVLLIFSINSSLLFYASQTFSESLFLFIQSCVLYYFLKISESTINDNLTVTKTAKVWIPLGLSICLLVLTRNIGLSILIACVLYLLLKKRFRQIIFLLLSVSLFFIPYYLYKIFFWGTYNAGFEDQLGSSMNINPYQSFQGKESIIGFISRFWTNSNLYISKNLLIILGFKDEYSVDVSNIITVMFYLLFFYIIYKHFKQNNVITFLLLYLGISLSITFLTQQIFWDQSRLIIIYSPIILVLIFYTFFEFAKNQTKFQPYILGIVLILFLSSFIVTIKKSKTAFPIFKENVKGDILYGYTPDWIHYIQMCQWTSQNIHQKINIGVRKPDIAYAYTQYEYFGLYRIPSNTIDDFEKNNIKNKPFLAIDFSGDKYFILDSLLEYRKNITAIINQTADEGKYYAIFDLPDSMIKQVTKKAKHFSIPYFTSASSFYKDCKSGSNSLMVVYPDSIVSFLKSHNTSLLIDANLRVDPTRVTQKTQNTIYKICQYVYYKYPRAIELIHQEGENNDEPARLYQIIFSNIR